MSKAASSPTARLLQTSRLFSLPRALPLQPEMTTGVYRHSETATTPYPIHQAIATPATSLMRGDWGLKRAIPNKKTRSSTPTIRVRANDTFEHITDFASAGDHVQTERKWAEMGIPMVGQQAGRSRFNSEPVVSVYEDWLDNTDPHAKIPVKKAVGRRVQAVETPKSMQRWKYNGPWLGGMQDGEFARYLQRTIGKKGKKEEWREFLRGKWIEEETRKARLAARESESQSESQIADEAQPTTPPEPPSPPTETELSAYEKQLRDQHASNGLSSPLTALLCEFLDLPRVYAGPPSPTRLDPNRLLHQLSESSDANTGPPTTHPSAGLSHLRTSALMHNHPLYGPQRDNHPVEARVVRPRMRGGSAPDFLAKLGVGGVVTEDPISATRGRGADMLRSSKGDDRMAAALDENLEGGNTMWVQPRTAYVDAASRIRLAVQRARPEAVAVRRDDRVALGEIREVKMGRKLL